MNSNIPTQFRWNKHAFLFHHFSYHSIYSYSGFEKKWCHQIHPETCLYWLLSPAFDDALGCLALHPSEKHALLFRSAGGCSHWQRGAYAHRRFFVEDMKALGIGVYGTVRFILVTTWNHEKLKQSSYRVVVWKMFLDFFQSPIFGENDGQCYGLFVHGWWRNNHQLVSTFGGLGLKKEQLFQLPRFWRRVQQVRLHADRPPQRDFRPNNKPKRTSRSQILAIFTSESTSGMLTTVLHPWHTKLFNLFCS